jgi:hypothetical protein
MRLVAPHAIDPHTIPLLTLPSVPFSERKHLPRCAAIYFVLNAQSTVLYVGQSINLAVRWAAHHRAATLTTNQATRIAWLLMEDIALLDATESACIAYFAPCCNGRNVRVRERAFPRKKPGPKFKGHTEPLHVMLAADLKAWLDAQPEGPSAIVRRALEAERRRTTS